jgi:hypothetical protein
MALPNSIFSETKGGTHVKKLILKLAVAATLFGSVAFSLTIEMDHKANAGISKAQGPAVVTQIHTSAGRSGSTTL